MSNLTIPYESNTAAAVLDCLCCGGVVFTSPFLPILFIILSVDMVVVDGNYDVPSLFLFNSPIWIAFVVAHVVPMSID